MIVSHFIYLFRNSSLESSEEEGHISEDISKYIWFESVTQKLVEVQPKSHCKTNAKETTKEESEENTVKPHSFTPESKQFNDYILHHSW